VTSGPALPSLLRRLTGALALLAATLPATAGTRRYVVLPFENLSSERSLSWLGDALAMSLSDRLELLGMRTVTRVERLDALEGLGIPDGKPVTLATALKIVASVRADRVVTGSFTYDPKSGVSVTGRLLDAGAAREIWEGTRPGTLAGIFALMDPLVIEAANGDASRLSPAAAGALTSIPDPPLPVYEILVRALQETEPEKRLAALRRALDVDQRSIPVLRAIALEQLDQGLLADALASVDAAPAEAGPDGWRMHLLRGRILAARGDLDGAVAALGKSIALGDSADAHLLLARLSASRGDADRAQAEVDLAAGIDPGNPELEAVRRLARRSSPRPI